MLMDWEVVEEAACKVKSFDFPRAPSHLAPKSARELRGEQRQPRSGIVRERGAWLCFRGETSRLSSHSGLRADDKL